MSSTTVHHRSCHLCEAICGVLLETEGDRVVGVRGDPDDPLSRGHICPKAAALKDLHDDPDRLDKPLVRRGGALLEVSWEEAFDEAERLLTGVQTRHGADALAVYQGNPTVHSLGAMTWGQVFLRSLGTRNVFSATSADQLPHMLASLLMYGHQLLMGVPDIDRTELLLVLGADPLVSGGSIMTAPGMRWRLKAIKERGGQVIVVDPRRSRTAEAADAHHFIRPGTDAALLMAMVHEVFAEGLLRPGRVGELLDGVDELERASKPFTPERAAAVTGVDAAVIRDLTRRFAETPRATIYGRFGVSTQAFGGLCQWLIPCLHALCGHLDEPGGMMFAKPAVDVVAAAAKSGFGGSFQPGETRGQGLPRFLGELPVAAMADEMTRPGPRQIRGLVTHAGNPVLSIPNGKVLDTLLPELEAVVCVDFYVNETTRHAHVILPPASPLSREHYDVTFHALAVRNTAKWCEPVFDKPAHARHDWQILGELAARVAGPGLGGTLVKTAGKAYLKRKSPRDIVALGLRMGPYGAGPVGKGGLTLQQLLDEPSGVDLGPLEPCFPERLYTDDKRVKLAPAPYLGDLERLDKAMAGERRPLVLIGRRQLRSNNSWMHNLPPLVKGKPRCTCWMHPDTARGLGLVDGQQVVAESRTGAITLPLEVTDAIMPGVVSIPHGWGHGREGVRLSVAAAHTGVSVNDITDELHVDELTGNAAFSGTPLSIRAA
jgi:anaerobic selenocysteine-containing dehydrogenase